MAVANTQTVAETPIVIVPQTQQLSLFPLVRNLRKGQFTNIELFAGAGGLALGLEEAGFNSLLLNDFDKDACLTLQKNNKDWNVVCDDIANLTGRDLLQELDLEKGELDLLSGGYPCQSFSYAGKRMGINDVRGTMFYYYAKILEQLMPKMFLAENVKGLTTHDGGKTLDTMIKVFTEIGYKVQYKVMNAWDYGVAQKRERVAIVGVRNDLDIKYEFPTPHAYKLVLKDILKDVPQSIGAKYPDKKRKVFDLVPQGGCWRDLPDDIAKDYMKGSYFLGGGKTGMARRIAWTEPSLTLTCSPCQRQTERCHPDETRPFTVREYARIQSFPDNWEFVGSMHSQYKQIGNAVPVNFAKDIGLSIIKTLKEVKK
ncbi:MAG: DNA cytosine methyltransferase [Christensenellaceae bacterium]|jgi:DNA (cytosine-5)-methyltransferase 1|nr:DNA cytosine methyltransferase [Christensenellaceae bacterium]